MKEKFLQKYLKVINNKNYLLILYKSTALSDDQINSLNDLYVSGFGDKASNNPYMKSFTIGNGLTAWKWKNQESPEKEKNICGIILYQEKIIGFISYLAFKAKIMNQTTIIYQENDCTIAEGHRGINLYKFARETLINYITSRQTAAIWYGFPNKINPVSHKKICKRWNIPVNLDVPFLQNNCLNQEYITNIFPIKQIPDEIDLICSSMISENSFQIIHDKKFYQWRYLDIPFNKHCYHILAHSNESNEIDGILVLKIYKENEQLKGHILDICTNNQQSFKKLVLGAEKFLIDNSINNCSLFLFPGTPNYDFLQQRYSSTIEGFVYTSGPLVLNLNFAEIYHNPFIQAGDNDVF